MNQLKLLLLPLLTAATLYASSTSCSNIYFGNIAPDFINTKLTAKTKELCYQQFAVMHSGVSRTPLWSAEHLTKEKLSQKAKRDNAFHAEEKLSSDDRAELNDYAHSGYDRGHMAPSADFTDPQSNHECFTLANMVPQDHNNNTGIWSSIEGATRYLTQQKGEIYIITGPIFEGSNIKRMNGRVFVPTKLFKAIYIPSSNQAAAYLTENASGNDYKVISIAELEKLIGINLFPKMSQDVKNHVATLPVPKPYHGGSSKNETNTQSEKPQSQGNGFFDKLERKIHNYNKGY
ncbi:MAG: DNA/RNA non-specific endonuclease [Thiovulaceae bacterium]|nr:DNA/RNA non-specific endonuclease [Sulfurimonadaceae bacterium]